MQIKTTRVLLISAISVVIMTICSTSLLAAGSKKKIKCPTSVGGYVAGEATSEFVKQCMGNPVHEDHNPDGRYVYLYQINGTTKVAFLFDASDKLIRTTGYQQN